MSQKFLFIDPDGTLIAEAVQGFQFNFLGRLALEPEVIPSLVRLQQAGFSLVLLTHQDGLASSTSLQEDCNSLHSLIMQIFSSQGIKFQNILGCLHNPQHNYKCHKTKNPMLEDYLTPGVMEIANSYVISVRQSDIQLANNLGIQGLLYQRQTLGWKDISQKLTQRDRHAHVSRITKETQIEVSVWLDREGGSSLKTGIGFFDHMLDQIATHGGLRMDIQVKGDLYIDDHHTVEDTALALGEALNSALGNKRGIARFGFVLPMDECLAFCAMDLSGRPYLKYKADFKYQTVGGLSTEMIEHFFHSLSYAMACSLHLKTKGKNDHHRVESLFKAFGRTLRQAIRVEGNTLTSSKGVLL